MAVLVLSLAAVTITVAVWGVVQTPIERPAVSTTVNDVTQLNPIAVSRVITPTATEEIVAAVRAHRGPIAIGGGRYSMGGQTATPGALHIDMRSFDRILGFDSIGKTITVQAGARWRQIQERVDASSLSVKIMQTYSNFTVGGSMSVNVHGRYIGQGPLVLSVRSFRIVLANGSLVEASRTKNPAIFFGAIGGYGGLGVITDATLDLADNVPIKRRDQRMSVAEYRLWFMRHVRDSAKVIFHNADIYPNEYDRVNAVTYEQTDEPVTIPDRLMPAAPSYRTHRFVYWMMSEWVGGKEIREHVVDPLLFRGEPVVWRNYEASYDVAELEPASRDESTYVLQEYFIPVDRFDDFVPKMRAIFQRNDANVINVSIRHAMPDDGTLLAWAPREVFAFVVYYKQGTDLESRRAVGDWTRELIEAAIEVRGSYYLPYQPHATESQFLRAYPRAAEFFDLKQRVDPTNKFRNTLWDTYYTPRVDPAAAPLPADLRALLDATPGYARPEAQTYLTHPEWYIVYGSEEYARWMRDRLPTGFPYVKSIGQFWVHYGEAKRLARPYPANLEYDVMLGVIGASYSAELVLKGAYENTIGRLSGWLAENQLSDEDWFAHEVATDYATFIHAHPWYEYSFAAKLRALWRDVPLTGAHPVRKWERRFFLTLEYGIKAAYASLIELSTRSAYVPQADRMHFVVGGKVDPALGNDPAVETVARLDSVHTLLSTGRYDAFRDVVVDLARRGSRLSITEIAGNDDILLTGVAPAAWECRSGPGEVVYSLMLPTDPGRKRFTMRVPVRYLIPVVGGLLAEPDVVVDHIYDY
jgi:FAD/FMN-containing dehydrogenase